MLTYKEFRKKLLTELDQRGIKFEITSMTSVNGEKERISIAFSNFTTDNAVDSDHERNISSERTGTFRSFIHL